MKSCSVLFYFCSYKPYSDCNSFRIELPNLTLIFFQREREGKPKQSADVKTEAVVWFLSFRGAVWQAADTDRSGEVHFPNTVLQATGVSSSSLQLL